MINDAMIDVFVIKKRFLLKVNLTSSISRENIYIIGLRSIAKPLKYLTVSYNFVERFVLLIQQH